MFPAFPSHQQFSVSYGMVMLCPGELDPGEWGCDSPWRKVPEDLHSKGTCEGCETHPLPDETKIFSVRKEQRTGHWCDVSPSFPSVKIWIFIPGNSSSQ